MRYKGRLYVLLTLLYLFNVPLQAQLTVAHDHLDDPQLVGEARLKVLLWNVFDASLYAQNGTYDANAPFTLSLRYLRELKSDRIVAKSMEEIQRQNRNIGAERLSEWEVQLDQIIPDVSKGNTITGVRTAEGYTRFYLESSPIGEIRDSAFTEAFFDIWLGESTSEPQLRNRLIGGESA